MTTMSWAQRTLSLLTSDYQNQDIMIHKNNTRHPSKITIELFPAKKKAYYFYPTFRRIIRNTPSCSL